MWYWNLQIGKLRWRKKEWLTLWSIFRLTCYCNDYNREEHIANHTVDDDLSLSVTFPTWKKTGKMSTFVLYRFPNFHEQMFSTSASPVYSHGVCWDKLISDLFYYICYIICIMLYMYMFRLQKSFMGKLGKMVQRGIFYHVVEQSWPVGLFTTLIQTESSELITATLITINFEPHIHAQMPSY